MSSGATMPARAPPSIDMLHTVMRPSIESARIAEPRYSMIEPTPPAVPMRAMIVRTMSFAVTPAGSSPSTVTANVPGFACGSVCVASTCSTSLVPMPNASAPSAPCVDVCESPHTIVMPGCVSPCSGPTTWTIPRLGSPIPKNWMPNSSQFCASTAICLAEIGSGGGPSGPVVGLLWSIVETVRSGRRTVRPASRRLSNACGDVTSWTRWRST